MSARSFVAQLRVHPDKRDELVALQTELKGLVFEREPEARVYELMQSETDPDLFLVVATYESEAAFDAHMTIDFHDRLVPPILACLDGEMKLDFYRSLG